MRSIPENLDRVCTNYENSSCKCYHQGSLGEKELEVENIKAFLSQHIMWGEPEVEKLMDLMQAESFDELLCTVYLNKIIWDMQENHTPVKQIHQNLTTLLEHVLSSSLPPDRKADLERIILGLINQLLSKKSS